MSSRWDSVALGDICSVTAGGTPSRSSAAHFGDGHPWVKIGDMLQGTIFATEESITKAGLDSSAAKLLPRGTVLVSIFATIGRTAVLGIEAATNQAIAGITPRNPDVLTPAYLRRYLDSLVATLKQRARGVAQVNINSGILRALPIPIPPVSEQRRIAEILDKADALRAKRRAALVQLDTLTQSIFLDMFGDPATNPKGWPRRTLGDLITVGPQNGLYKPADDYGTGTPILRIDAFYDGVVTKLSHLKRVRLSGQERALFALREGEIVVNRVNSREYLGKSALIPALSETTVFESNMMRFDVDREMLEPSFLIQYLQTSFVRAHVDRSAKDAVNQSSINQKDVTATPVVVPPIATQRLFAQRLAVNDRLKESNKQSSVGLDTLFASLQHRAFRGEL